MVRILAIDPSITKMGVAILDNGVPIQMGTLETKQKDSDRFLELAMKVKKIILEYKPDHLAIETQYIAGAFGNAILKTCEVKGVIRGVFMLLKPEGSIFDISPSEAKKEIGVTGKRKEAKIATVRIVTDMFKLLVKVDDNACDAVIIGLSAHRKLTT